MNWLESILYGLVSGLTEFLPVSSRAHQKLLQSIFGVDHPDPVYNLVVHLALLGAIWAGCRKLLDPIRREYFRKVKVRHSSGRTDGAKLEWTFIKNAVFPLIVVMIILLYFNIGKGNLMITSIFLLVNGVILFLPSRMISGNKDGRTVSLLDSTLFGAAAGLSGIVGISRIGTACSVAAMRGIDKHKAFNWALLISIPALMLMSGYDIISIFANGADVHFWSHFFTYILAAAGAYAGGYISIMLAKLVVTNSSFSGFAYYSWGAALITFILYLTIA